MSGEVLDTTTGDRSDDGALSGQGPNGAAPSGPTGSDAPTGSAFGRLAKKVVRRPEAAVGLVAVAVVAITTLKSDTFLTSADRFGVRTPRQEGHPPAGGGGRTGRRRGRGHHHAQE